MAHRSDPAIDALDDALRHSDRLRAWLRGRPWCGEAIGKRAEVAVKDRAVLSVSGTEALVLFVVVAKQPERQVVVHLPLSLAASRTHADAFELAAGAGRFFVTEAERREAYARFLAAGFQRQAKVPTMAGDTLHFRGEAFGAHRSIVPAMAGEPGLPGSFETEQRAVVFKSYKVLDVGNREPDILERLHRKRFPYVPRCLGELALGRGSDRLVLGVATGHVDAIDLFTWLTEGLRGELGGGAEPSEDFERGSLDVVEALGGLIAALHEALLDRHPGSFQGETFRPEDTALARRGAITDLGDALRGLAAIAKAPDAALAERAATARRVLFDNRRAVEETLRGLDACVGTPKCVTHGDLQLAKVLRRAGDGGLLFVGFDGGPEGAAGRGSAKLPPLRDVATVIRSLAHVRHRAWRDFVHGHATSGLRRLEPDALAGEEQTVARRLLAWERSAVERVSAGYLARSALYGGLGPDEALRAIRGWMMERVLHEFRCEMKQRPDAILVPLEGIVSLAGVPPGPLVEGA